MSYLEQSSEQQVSTECPSPVYDEYTSGIDSDLQQQIDNFEAKGVLVRVIVQETLSDEGYGNLTAMDDETFTQTVDAYSNEVISTCGYEEANSLTLIRIVDDKAVNIVGTGSIKSYESDHFEEFDGFVVDFLNLVRDDDTSDIQSETAQALQSIYTTLYGKSDEPKVLVPQVETPVATTTESRDIHHFPIAEVGLGGLGIVALGSALYLTKNRISARNEALTLSRDVKVLLEERKRRCREAYIQDKTNDDLIETESASEATALLLIPKDDVPQLYELRESLERHYPEWKEHIEKLEQQYTQSCKGFIPNRKQLDAIKHSLDTDPTGYFKYVTAYEDEVKILIERSNAIEQLLIFADTELLNFSAEASKLIKNDAKTEADSSERKSYTMPSLEQLVSALNEKYQTARSAYETEHRINGPIEILESVRSSIKETTKFIEQVPLMHHDLINAYHMHVDVHELTGSKIKNAQSLLEDLEQNYNQACIGTVRDDLTRLQTIGEKYESEFSGIVDPTNETNIDTLVSLSNNLKRIAKTSDQFSEVFDSIRNHSVYIKELEQNLPVELRKLESYFADISEFTHTNTVRIDDETEQELVELMPEFDSLSVRLSSDKPDFIAIQQDLESLHSKAKRIVVKAEAQNKEIHDLDQAIEDATQSHASKWSTLNKYEQRHPDVDAQTEFDIAQARDDIDSATRKQISATAENRNALRAQLEFILQANSLLDEIAQDAKHDVVREEQKRAAAEALRQAELARVRAERAREQARKTANQMGSIFSTSFHNSPSRSSGISHVHRGGSSHVHRG